MEENQQKDQIDFHPSSEQTRKSKLAMTILPLIYQTKLQVEEIHVEKDDDDDQIDFIDFHPSSEKSEQSEKIKPAMSLLPSIRQTKTQIQTEPQTQEMQNNTEQEQISNSPGIEQQNPNGPLNANLPKTPTLMTVNTLAMIPYSEFSKAEYSQKPFYNISGYAFNSYNGTEKSYNEDRTKVIINYPKQLIANGKTISPHISYFGIFDGHGGEACSNFLKENLDSFLFNSNLFPANPIQAIKEAFMVAEDTFKSKAIDKNKILDRSGSCACVILIINDVLYAINLGDSRALLSSESGQTLCQITRDHKPEDPIEKNRIENAGAVVYYANTIYVNGEKVVLNESDYGEGFKFPYRIRPGGMAVSFIL